MSPSSWPTGILWPKWRITKQKHRQDSHQPDQEHYLFVNIFIHSYICLPIYFFIYMYNYVNLLEYICFDMRVCICRYVHIRVCVCVCVWVGIHLNIHMCIHTGALRAMVIIEANGISNLSLFMFCFMPLRKAWIHLLSSSYELIVGQAGSLSNLSRRRKTLNSNQLYSAEKFTLCHTLLAAKGLDSYIHIYK